MSKILIAGDQLKELLATEIKWFNAPFWDLNTEMPDLSEFDILRMYFLNSLKPAMIKGIKNRYPNLKVIATVDSDYWWVTNPWIQGFEMVVPHETMLGLQMADLMFCVNPVTHLWYLRNHIKSVLGFFAVPEVTQPTIEPKSFEGRLKNKKAAILVHSQPQYYPQTNLEAAKKLGLKPVFIGTFQNMDILKEMTRNYPDAELHERITNTEKYYEVLNECLISLEDWYAGGSRFGIECASIGLPIVGSKNALSLLILNPELTCRNGDVACLVEKAKLLIANEQLYTQLSKRIKEKVRTHLSEEACKKRYIRAIKWATGIDL